MPTILKIILDASQAEKELEAFKAKLESLRKLETNAKNVSQNTGPSPVTTGIPKPETNAKNVSQNTGTSQRTTNLPKPETNAKSVSQNAETSKSAADVTKVSEKIQALPKEKTITVKAETKGADTAIVKTGKEMKNITIPAETFGTKAKSAFKNVWKELSDGEGLLKNLTGALKGVLSPIGAIALGFAALGKLAADIWNRMTLSAAEYLEQTSRAADAAGKKREKLQEAQSRELQYLASLRELASQEQLSNNAKQEAGVLLDLLSAKYGDLGVEIDKAGNRLTGFDKAQEKVLSKMRRDRIAAGEREYSILQDQAFAQAQYAVTGMIPGEETLNQFGITLRGANGAKGITADLMRNTPLENQLGFARHMMLEESKTQDEMDRWGKVVEILERMIERRKELNALDKSGFANDQERAEAYRANAALDTSVKQNREQAEIRKADRDFAAERDPEEKLANREKLISGELENQKRLREEIAIAERKSQQGDFENQRVAAKKRMLELTLQLQESEEKIAGWSEQIAQIKRQTAQQIEDAKENVRLQKLLVSGKYEEYELEKLKLEARQQGRILTDEDAKTLQKQLEAQRSLATQKRLSESADELKIQRAILNAEYEKAEALRLQLEQKKENRKYSAAELAEIKKQNAERQNLEIGKSLQDQAYNARYAAMRQAGLGREAEQEKALRDAESIKRAELTPAETALVKQLADLNYTMQNPGRTALDTIGGAGIKTNSLTARGGFASGGVAPDQDRINRAIEGHNRRIAGQMENALRLMDDIKKCLTG